MRTHSPTEKLNEVPTGTSGQSVSVAKAPSWKDVQTLPLEQVANILDVEPDMIRQHERAGRRSDAFNLPGTIAMANLRAHVEQVRQQQSESNISKKELVFPHQQVRFLEAVVSQYPEYPQILPKIRTSHGRFPSRPMRSMISAVLISVISLTDFDTFRICYTSKSSLNNRFSGRGPLDMGQAPISLKAIARRVGFTYWANGIELVDRKFRRAYDLLRKSGYIFSHQKQKRNQSTFSGFDMAMRWVSPALFDDMRSALPHLVSEDQWAALRKHARKRAARTRKLYSLKDLPALNACSRATNALRQRLTSSGFTQEFLREVILRFVLGSTSPAPGIT